MTDEESKGEEEGQTEGELAGVVYGDMGPIFSLTG